SFYWIVPQLREGIPTAVINVDARFGTYQQARVLPEPRATALLLHGHDEVHHAVHERLHQLPDELGELRIRSGLACITDPWVWRPCRESLSPYYPFKLVTYGAHQLYVRSDGRVFTHLTTTGRGI